MQASGTGYTPPAALGHDLISPASVEDDAFAGGREAPTTGGSVPAAVGRAGPASAAVLQFAGAVPAVSGHVKGLCTSTAATPKQLTLLLCQHDHTIAALASTCAIVCRDPRTCCCDADADLIIALLTNAQKRRRLPSTR